MSNRHDHDDNQAQRRVQRPPQLLFDDGSRAMTTNTSAEPTTDIRKRTSSVSEYYEIERLTQSIQSIVQRNPRQEDGWLVRVALQFPDDLLADAPEVCWALEESLSHKNKQPALVFCLGDTTFASCCPDEISALHLNADVLIHYGHACLSPARSLPVLYSFGVESSHEWINDCVQQVLQQARQSQTQRILLLYQVCYHAIAVEELQTQLSERGDVLVVAGQIPQPLLLSSDENDEKESTSSFRVGGLELPLQPDDDLSSYAMLYIGDTSQNTRQYVNILLRFLSTTNGPSHYWKYSPQTQTLDTSSHQQSKQLNRRFYLTQKARDAHVFGILVGTLSQQHFGKVVQELRTMLLDAGKACYTFAIGKINQAKLANFAEIECFVLVACSEHSLLKNERDLHVPVITPLELSIALGHVEWGGAYSLDYMEFLGKDRRETQHVEDDAPYFSLVTGNYQAAKRSETTDLTLQPGQGQLMAYKSEAVDFLKQREYQGLQVLAGETEPQAAVTGQSGIASNYGEMS